MITTITVKIKGNEFSYSQEGKLVMSNELMRRTLSVLSEKALEVVSCQEEENK